MSNPEKMKIDDAVSEEEREDIDQQCSGDEEPAVREIVLGLPALRISSERFGVSVVGSEEEARLNEQAVIAAQMVVAAAEEAVMKEKSDGKKKKKKVSRPRKMMSVNDEAGGSRQGGESSKPKRKEPAFNQIRGPPVCHICGRKFGSWKGVDGHMRCHKNRNYRGFVPPRKFPPIVGGFTIPGPNSAFVLFSAGGGSSGGFVAGGSGAAPGGEGGRGVEIDLNVDPVEEEEEQKVTESGTPAKFDLNKSPPKDEEEDKAT